MEKRIQTQTGDGIAPYEDEIELMDYILVVWKRKWIVIIVTMLFFLVGAVYTLLHNLFIAETKYITETVVQLNFQGIEKHINPDGSQFEKEQLITPQILSVTATSFPELNNNSNLMALRGMIDINSITPPEVLKKIKIARAEKGIYTFFPNTFSIVLTATDDIFSEKERNQIIYAILSNYKTEFVRKYGEEPLLLTNFPKDFLIINDHPAIARMLKEKINGNINWVNSKIKSAGFFRSKETGFSFHDIKFEANMIKDNIVQLEKIILAFNLTKSREKLVELLTANIQDIEKLKQKKSARASLARELLGELKAPRAYNISSQTNLQRETSQPAVTFDQSFIEGLIKNNAYLFLMKEAMETGTVASNLAIDKEFLEKRITQIKKEGVQKIATYKTEQHIEKELENTIGRIIALSKRANTLNKEYLTATLHNIIQVISEPQFSKIVKGGRSIKKNVALATCVGFFLAIFLTFLMEYLSKYKSRQKELMTIKTEAFDDGVKKAKYSA